VRWNDLLFLSGQAPLDQTTLAVVSPDFDVQVRYVLDRIAQTLKEAGSSLDNVIRVEAYLEDALYFANWNVVWAEYFKPPRPARTTIVSRFTVPGMLVEVQVTAGISL
jgi:2-iminobutanoate/2-iminopropanoate deaminase